MSRHRRCDSRCTNAQPGSPCSCQCGGRNHAGAWQPDPVTGERPAPRGIRYAAKPWTPTRHTHTEDADQLTLTLA